MKSVESFVSEVNALLVKKNAKLGKKYSLQITGSDPRGIVTTGILTDANKLATCLAGDWSGYSNVTVCLYRYNGRKATTLFELEV